MPILDQNSLEFPSLSAEQTTRFGARLGELLKPGDLVTVSGEIGAGKTTFIIGVGRGWGALEPVTSPSFVIVNEHRRADRARLWHLDCYRLRSGAEALALGFEDLLDSNEVMLIEWPERITEALPAEHLRLSLRWLDETKRTCLMNARGPRYEELLRAFRQNAFGR